jgi:hypothetical protein
MLMVRVWALSCGFQVLGFGFQGSGLRVRARVRDRVRAGVRGGLGLGVRVRD